MKPSESSEQRTQRVCGMFLDWWVHSRFTPCSVLLVGTRLESLWWHETLAGPAKEWWSWFPESKAQQVGFPSNKTFDLVVIRMPPEKQRLKLAMEVCASRLAIGGHMLVFGSNDEGIRSITKLGQPFFHNGVTLEARKHARIVHFHRVKSEKPRRTMSAYKQSSTLTYQNHRYDWSYFPGTFAKGKLDPGSGLLLDALRSHPPVDRMLDFGCGTGVLCGLSELGAEIHALDRDYLALEALKHNVDKAIVHWSDRWVKNANETFDLILSNPPIHDGKVEDYRVVQFLLKQAQSALSKNGELWMVVQHRVPIEHWMPQSSLSAEVMSQDRVYKVWRMRRPDKDAS